MAKELEYLEYTYRHNRQTTSLLNSIFMSTVNTAAKTLVSVASTSKTENVHRWKAADHLRFMVMLMTWLTVWVLRVLMDHFPVSLTSSSSSSWMNDYFLGGGGAGAGPPLLELQPFSSSAASTTLVSASAGSASLDVILADDEPSVKSLGRALSHILALVNEIPATSRKYQFAMSMADKIMEENARVGHVELLQVNRTALASSFARTSTLLHASLDSSAGQNLDEPSAWPVRAVKMLPLGSYIASYVKGLSTCIDTVMWWADTGNWLMPKRRESGVDGGNYSGAEREGEVAAEKLAQELLWVTDKLRAYGAVEEAIVQWSYASGLASLALNVGPRVQGIMVKISAILCMALARDDVQVSRQVRYRLLVLWLPLFCHARNGHVFPILTSFEKAEVERAIDRAISDLPAIDQEVVLTNWLQDFSASVSEWPNLQPAYDRWCRITRQLVA